MSKVVITEENVQVTVSAASIEGPAGPAGEGVPAGGTTGQALVKNSNADYDTKWATGGGGGSDDQTAAEVPFTPAGNVGATDVQAAIQELDSEKAAVSHTHSGADITSGTVADARIASSIARDSEVTAAVSASEAGQVRDGDAAGGVLSGTYPDPGFAADMATQAELDAHVSDPTAAHAASAISYAGGTGMSATDVEAAVDELATEKANAADVPTNATFNAHALRHADGGADEITAALDPRAYPMLAGLLASRPAAGVTGRFYWTTDEHILYRDSGSVWAKVAVADYPDLESIPSSFAPSAHASSHQDGGSDEISIQGLAGTPAELTNHLNDTADAHDASAISNVPAGGIAATDVQAALNELDSEKADAASAVMDGDAAGGDLAGTYPSPTLDIAGLTATTTLDDAAEIPLALSGANKKITGANLKASVKRVLTLYIDGTLTTGDGQVYYPVPAVLNGLSVTAVAAYAVVASSSGAITVQIARDRGGTVVDVLSTTLTIDANEKSSATAATAAVINTSNDDLATGDLLRVDLDSAGTGASRLMVQVTAA